MNDGSQIAPATIRAEVKALFGLRWDTAVEWAVICWLSAWLLTTSLPAAGAEGGRSEIGPIGWIADTLGGLDLGAPAWIEAISTWLRDPARSWLEPVLIVVSAVLLTAAVRSVSLAGLRTMALVALVGALEISRTYGTAGAVLFVALVPSLTAIVFGVVAELKPRDRDVTEFYLPVIIMQKFLTQVVFVILAPLVAPVLLLAMLVLGYKSSLPYRPAVELASEVRRRMEQSNAPLAETDALTASSAFVSAMLAGSSSREAQEVLAGLHLSLRDRSRAEEMQRREASHRREGWG